MTDPQEPVLASPITLENRSLWFATIELRREEIVIQGWSWTGAVTERIPIDDISVAEKWTVSKGPNFRLRSTNGRPSVFGRIHEGAKFWELALERDDRFDLKLRH